MKNEEKKVINEKNEKKELNDKDIEQVTGGAGESVVVLRGPELATKFEIKLSVAVSPAAKVVDEGAAELIAEPGARAAVEGADLPTSNAY